MSRLRSLHASVATSFALALLAGLGVPAVHADEGDQPRVGATAPREDPATSPGWFDPFIDLRSLVVDGFVERPDPETLDAMRAAALEAMVSALGDPYSVYVPPEEERGFSKDILGTYVGIGAEIDISDGYLRVVTPLEDSPAQEVGVMPGDLVLSINGESTYGRSSLACMEQLLGEPGTSVRLELRHVDGREEAVLITRREIQTHTVKGFRRTAHGWDHMLDPARGIAYVRLTQFTETTADDLRETLEELMREGGKGLILDLRYNGGGSLGAAIQVADLFLRGGTIVSLRGRDGKGRSWSASEQTTDLDLPIVVLVNSASASASEVLAGALQDNGRAKVLGTRTYGKGSVQEVRPLPEGNGTLKLTTARYYLPSGRNLTRPLHPDEGETAPWGVDPDPGFVLPMTDEEQRAALMARREWEIPERMATASARFDDPGWLAATTEAEGGGFADRQLAGAEIAMRERLGNGTWPRVGDDPSTEAAQVAELSNVRAWRDRLVRELESAERRIRELEVELEDPHADSRSATPGTGSADANK